MLWLPLFEAFKAYSSSEKLDMNTTLENNLHSLNVMLMELLGCCKSTAGLIDEYAEKVGTRRDACYQRKANHLLSLAQNTDVDGELVTNLVETNRELRDVTCEVNSLKDISGQMLVLADQTRRIVRFVYY